MQTKFLSFVFVIILMISTSIAQVVKIDSSAVQRIRIDPATAKGVPAGQLFEKVEFIPLETNEKSLFGRLPGWRL